jgi:hypothetical protein
VGGRTAPRVCTLVVCMCAACMMHAAERTSCEEPPPPPPPPPPAPRDCCCDNCAALALWLKRQPSPNAQLPCRKKRHATLCSSRQQGKKEHDWLSRGDSRRREAAAAAATAAASCAQQLQAVALCPEGMARHQGSSPARHGGLLQ